MTELQTDQYSVIVEGRIPSGWEEKPLKEGEHNLHFPLVGALITKSRIESDGNKAIVVEVHTREGKIHYEVHTLRIGASEYNYGRKRIVEE